MEHAGLKQKGEIMLRKSFLAVVIVVFTASYCFAQAAREASFTTVTNPGVTNLTNLSVYGLDVQYNPGYVALVGADGASYFLWVDNSSRLRIASYAAISAYSSYPTGNWSTPEFAPGVVVGGQS